MCESLALSGHVLTQATSAGEVFTTEVPKKALTGRVLLLSQNTSIGRRILGDVVPKDREYAANGIDIGISAPSLSGTRYSRESLPRSIKQKAS